MKRTAFGLTATAIACLAVTVPTAVIATPASAAGSDTCLQGYVWREARATDRVCVTPAIRTQTAQDNSVKASRWTNGAYGPHTCVTGYVWREAFTGDDVCVTPAIRAQVKLDNSKADERRLLTKVWTSRYNGDGSRAVRIQVNGDHFNFGQVALVVRDTQGKERWRGSVNASAHVGFAGGSFGKKLQFLDCSSPDRLANGEVEVYDVVSRRQTSVAIWVCGWPSVPVIESSGNPFGH
ncbi:hypothetical protein [Streptosporangium sp. NPDC087985]|uniref:hypothetical protein n=1 Tax=Streptosporangium sp. NPDC087985 TaxID=3366196 RepID=UPI00381FD569